MTGAVTGWAIALPHNDIGHRLRALLGSIVTAGASARARRQDRARRDAKPYYPQLREASFEEAAMAREMYRL